MINVLVRMADGSYVTGIDAGMIWIRRGNERSTPVSGDHRPDRFLERCLWLAPLLTVPQLRAVINGPEDRTILPTVREVLRLLAEKPRTIDESFPDRCSLEWVLAAGLIDTSTELRELTPAGRLFLDLKPAHHVLRGRLLCKERTPLETEQTVSLRERTTCVLCQQRWQGL